ncbi:hypothetical protein HAX54_025446 [Datura stramonium]|uniref:Uncharacterized protein n=1 Tax=Datura stramonium TaxID=4076 RepID=A0ABS8V0N7_DATST|nr:hypothetical protein [Datura stramonium]
MEKIPRKGSRRSSKRLKSSTPSPSDVNISNSSSDECPESTSSLKKPSSSVSKKGKTDSSVSFDLDDKKASYKPKIKHASPEGPRSVKIDEAHGVVLNSLSSEAWEIKQSLGAVVGDLYKCTELMGKLSADMTSLQVQISLIQKEGVKSFNPVLK